MVMTSIVRFLFVLGVFGSWHGIDASRKKRANRARMRKQERAGAIEHTEQQPNASVCEEEMASRACQGVDDKKFYIRVLLDKLAENTPLRLSSEHGFVLRGLDETSNSAVPTKTLATIADSEIEIEVREGRLWFNKREGNQLCTRECKDTLLSIAPISGQVLVNSKPYQGYFLIARHKEKNLFINMLDLEEYVCSVLHTESWPGWPLEIQKVCAITCRSYAIATALRAHKLKKIYHIKNTNEHQTYTGCSVNPALRKAVDDTRGVFIAYERQPILAMYDICCGGIVPAHAAHVNFADAPYLARSYACSYCKTCKSYAWEVEYQLAEFEKLVSTVAKPVKKVRSIAVSKKDKAGLVREVTLKHHSRVPLCLSGQKLYSLIKEVKSLCFQTRKEGSKLVIKGRGYGHHLGLCQWGARELVRQGWPYKRILQFYYPGTNLMRIT